MDLRNKVFSKLLFVCFSLLLLLSLTACGPKTPPPPSEPLYFDHTVKFSGETLAVISAWYTGSSKNWQAMAEANPQIKPNRIKIGDTIHIPHELLTKFEPLPKKFLKNPKSDVPDPQPSSKKSEETKPVPVTTEEKQDTSSSTAEKPDSASPTDTSPSTPAVEVQPAPAAEPQDEMVPAFEENLVIEPTPAANDAVTQEAPPAAPAPTLSPEEKAREDLIDEILRK